MFHKYFMIIYFAEEHSPKKKLRAPPKPIQPVPLIPTHQRTTRYKETMKKEAKKIAARERRIKKKASNKTRKELEQEKQIIAEVLDQVLEDVEKKIRRKMSRSKKRAIINANPPSKEVKFSKETPPSKDLKPTKENPSLSKASKEINNKIRAVRHRRELKVKTYKEDSSDSDTEEASKSNEDTDKANTSDMEVKSPLVQKIVIVKVSNDEDLNSVTDIEAINVRLSTEDLIPSQPFSPTKNNVDSPRILKRLESTLVTDDPINVSSEPSSERSKHSARQQYSVEMKMSAISRMENGESQDEISADLQVSVSMLAAWWIRRSDIKTNYVNKLANDVDESPVKNVKQRSRSMDLKPVSNSVKVNAVKSILKGKSHQRVAKEIGVSPSQVNLWWKRKDQILRRNKRLSVDNENVNKETNSNVKPEKKSPGKENVESKNMQSKEPKNTSKNTYSLEFKKQVIDRIEAGENLSAVAKELRLSESTVSVWWVRRAQIGKRLQSSEIVSAPSIEKAESFEPVPIFENVEKVENVVLDGPTEDKSKDEKELDQRPRSRRSVSNSVRTSTPVLTSRWCMPLEVKQSAIRRMETGATQALVAKDLDVSLSTVATWWRKKDTILGNTSINEKKIEEKTPESGSVISNPPPTSQIDDLGVFELEKLMTDDASSNNDEALKQKEIKNKMNKDEAGISNGVIEQHDNAADDSPKRNDLIIENNLHPQNLNENQSKIDFSGEDKKDSLGESSPTVNENDSVKKEKCNINVEESINPVKGNEEGINSVKEDKDSDNEDNFDAEEEALLKLAEISQRDSTPRPQSVNSLSSTPRPQSGLQMILSYCSSDEDL